MKERGVRKNEGRNDGHTDRQLIWMQMKESDGVAR